jgi:CDP-paratose 2-epimerase
MSASNGNGRGSVLITGGAGFVGTNLAERLIHEDRRVRVLDDLSRPGVERNLSWLERTYGDMLEIEVADLRNGDAVRRAVAGVDQIFHFAAQVAVTTSLDDPLHDFRVNLAGTMNLLERARAARRPPGVVFTSTNKVYGSLGDVEVTADSGRWEPVDPLVAQGVSESRPLQFCTPYGCSKGAADQYVLDYAASYRLPTCVLRMSCIYGPHQFGTEDQGWVAHFLISALAGEPITIYGDGRQVRDVLYVEDLAEAMVAAGDGIARLSGRAFNIGGGPAAAVSLREVIDSIGALREAPPEVDHSDWRAGDQRWYVSDTRAFSAATGWRPRVMPAEGIRRLHEWLLDAEEEREEAARESAGVAS